MLGRITTRLRRIGNKRSGPYSTYSERHPEDPDEERTSAGSSDPGVLHDEQQQEGFQTSWQQELDSVRADIQQRLASVQHEWEEARSEYGRARRQAKASLASDPLDVQHKPLAECVRWQERLKRLGERHWAIQGFLDDTNDLEHLDWRTHLEERLTTLSMGTRGTSSDVSKMRDQLDAVRQRWHHLAERVGHRFPIEEPLPQDEKAINPQDARIQAMREELLKESPK